MKKHSFSNPRLAFYTVNDSGWRNRVGSFRAALATIRVGIRTLYGRIWAFELYLFLTFHLLLFRRIIANFTFDFVLRPCPNHRIGVFYIYLIYDHFS